MTVQNASETSKITLSTNGAREIYADEVIDLFGEKYQQKVEKYGSTFLQCVFCGKNVSRQGNCQGVWVGAGGASIIHTEDTDKERSDAGWMGWFPVGSECIKVVPKEFRSENPYPEKERGV